jgi:hypothetical protein
MEVSANDLIAKPIPESGEMTCVLDQGSGFRRLRRDDQFAVNDFDRHAIRDAKGDATGLLVRPVPPFTAHDGSRLRTRAFRFLSICGLIHILIAVQEHCVD